MATRFDSQEYAKQKFLNLCSKYFPKDHLRINVSKRKGFRLADSTVSLIQQSIDIVAKAKELQIAIPTSSANIFRYGTVLIAIFENISKYQTISQLKSRSRRGYRKEIDVLDFDLKKIELELKKTSNPPIKVQKDEKMIRDLKKFYLEKLDNDEFLEIINDAVEKQKLFVLEDSEGKKFFDSLLRQINTLIGKDKELNDLKSHFINIKEKYREFVIRKKGLEKNLSKYKNEVESYREKHGISILIEEKEKLLADSDLSLFLKIITTCLERYVKMIERRENRELDRREDFLNLVVEPTRYKGLTEDLWREIVFIVETYGFELIGSKTWFRFVNPEMLRKFIVQKEVLEKYAHLRKLEDKLDEIEDSLIQNPQYLTAIHLIKEYNDKSSQIFELDEKIPKTEEEITLLSKAVEDNKELIRKFLL